MTPPEARAGIIDRDDLVRYLDDYLEVGRCEDYCPNGLQVEGRNRIRRLVTGVSACAPLFEAARQRQADAVLVHHGLLWFGAPLPLVGVQYRRIAQLVATELSLIAYHLPLDRHPEIGNNAIAARRLGLEDLTPFGDHRGAAIGWRGRRAALPVDRLLQKIESIFGSTPIVFAHGPARISSVGIVSGAGGRFLHEAIAVGLDMLITGEAEEWSMNLAREAGIHFVAAGHHASERLGVEALGDHLRGRFAIEIEFVDVPNPV